MAKADPPPTRHITTGPVASLPMYDWPEVRDAMDALWSAIASRLRRRGIEAPAGLTRSADFKSLWYRPDLLLSQTCGYPYVTELRGRVQLVATPCYRAPGCDGPTYRSLLLVRRDSAIRTVAELRGATAVINSTDSQSGYSALRAVIAPHARAGRFFGKVLTSGAHRASLRMVAAGEADVCATDAVCAAMARVHDVETMGKLRILAKSPRAPSLPLITALSTPPAVVHAMREALADMVRDKGLKPTLARLLIEGFEVLDDSAYDRIAAIEARAIALGYPHVQ